MYRVRGTASASRMRKEVSRDKACDLLRHARTPGRRSCRRRLRRVNAEPRQRARLEWGLEQAQCRPLQPSPEHESLACGGFIIWRCFYFKIPEPALNFYWNTNRGFFQGTDVTDGWTCPAWFPAGICGNIVQVVHGTIVFVDPGVHPPFSVVADLIVSGAGSSRKLSFYWVGQFVCPWFRTFAQALAANPMPLPFDGVNWAPQDCVSAP